MLIECHLKGGSASSGMAKKSHDADKKAKEAAAAHKAAEDKQKAEKEAAAAQKAAVSIIEHSFKFLCSKFRGH